MTYLFLFVLILSSAGVSQAEFIRMKDGREFDGQILQESQDSVRVRERCGESIIEIDYPKADIERIGLPPEDEQKEEGQAKAKTSPEQGAEVEEDPGYEQGIDRIIAQVTGLKSVWEADQGNCIPARKWLKENSSFIKEFKGKYGKSKRISYSYVKLGLLKLSNFFSYLGDIEEKQKVYKENVTKDTPENVKASLKETILEYERLACESLNLADQYLKMAKAKTLK